MPATAMPTQCLTCQEKRSGEETGAQKRNFRKGVSSRGRRTQLKLMLKTPQVNSLCGSGERNTKGIEIADAHKNSRGQSADRIDRLIRRINRLSGATRRYDHFFANGRQEQLKINNLISDALNYFRHAIQMSDDLISARRYIGKLKRAVLIRQNRSLQLGVSLCAFRSPALLLREMLS